MSAVGMSKKQINTMIKSGTRLLIGLLFSGWLFGFLVTSYYAYIEYS